MKHLLLLCFLVLCLSVNGQYKHFSAGATATTHNFESSEYYSSPGIRLQYNFKRYFSLNLGYSETILKHSFADQNDMNSNVYFINSSMKKSQIKN